MSYSDKNISNKVLYNYNNAKPTYWSDSHNLLELDEPYSCTSQICNQSFYDAPFFHFWAKNFFNFDHQECTSSFVYHRKLWELVYVCQSLYERGMIQKGKKRCCLWSRAEVLPDLFASYGCEILATDLDAANPSSQAWIDSGQNVAGNLQKLNRSHFCDSETFEKKSLVQKC